MTNKDTVKNFKLITASPSPSPAKGGARWETRLKDTKLKELKEKGLIHREMDLDELRDTRFRLASYFYSKSISPQTAKDVEIVASCWKEFYENASAEEWKNELPFFTQMVDNVCTLIDRTNRLSIAQSMLDSLYLLIPAEPKYVLGKLVKLMNDCLCDENVRVLALTKIEASYPFMVSTPENSLFYIMESTFNQYERNQDHLFRNEAQEFAKASSGFIFAHREYLMENGYKDLIPYVIAWATGMIGERVNFMEKIADGSDSAFKIGLFSRIPTLIGIMPARSHEISYTQAMVIKFPELGRVFENNKKLTQIEEFAVNQRIVDTATRLLWDSGVQFVYPMYASNQLH